MHFVIIGNGVAGTTAALALRQREPKADITMISGESDYYFSRTALMYAYMDRMSLRDLEPFERKVFSKQNIRLVRDWVTDLDANRRTLQLKSGRSITYDRLLLAVGSLANRPAWPGFDQAREGIAHFVTLQDLEQCERLTNSTREAVVVGGGLIGVELVECLVFHGKKVTFLVRSPHYWPAALEAEESEIVTAHIRRHGVDVRGSEEISEVLLDDGGRVRSVRTKTGDEFPCQMLGVAIGVGPAAEWLRHVTTPPRMERGISVSPDFATSLENVWAAGDCAEFTRDGKEVVEQIWYTAKRHGELAACAMLGDRIHYEPPIFYNSAKFFEIEYTTSGMAIDVPESAKSFFCRIPGEEASVRVIAHNDAVIGFNMLGARWDHTFFERWILERRTMDYAIEHLAEAQFDVEFGRLDLSVVAPRYREWKTQPTPVAAAH
ncbi:MAG TPA: FAD/NAD(P)-binding oxidoreductase [Candidatus Acidoferrales bacterium]|nr:FAD/NAD(P)-binding oxidoreductase [Candidatus Acidoferrales bacterium]